MDNKKIKELIKLDQKIKEITFLRDSIRESLLEDLEQAGLEKAVTEVGTLTKASKTIWRYTEKVTSLEEKVKVAKVREQQNGSATKNESYYLRFTPTIK